MKFDSSDKIVLNITNTCNNNNIFFLTDPKNLQKISNLQHCLKFYDLDTWKYIKMQNRFDNNEYL
jgi:hypothetical protein